MRLIFLGTGVSLLAGAMAMALLPSVAANGIAGSADGGLFLGALVFFLLSAGVLAWREPHAFVLLMGACSLFGLFAGLMAFRLGPPSLSLFLHLAVSAAALVLVAAYLMRNQFGASSVPDVLAALHPNRSAFETGGVQLIAVLPEVLPTDVIAPVDVYLQNCTDASRKVRVKLDDKSFFGRGGKVRWRAPDTVELGPTEVVHLQFPVCAAKMDQASTDVYFDIHAWGRPGKRVRRRRARYAAPPLSNWQILLTVLILSPIAILVVTDRGGIKSSLRFIGAGPLRSADELPAPTVTTLWRPPDGASASSLKLSQGV